LFGSILSLYYFTSNNIRMLDFIIGVGKREKKRRAAEIYF